MFRVYVRLGTRYVFRPSVSRVGRVGILRLLLIIIVVDVDYSVTATAVGEHLLGACAQHVVYEGDSE